MAVLINEAGNCNGLTLWLRGTYSAELAYEMGSLETFYGWAEGTADELILNYTDGYLITSTQELMEDDAASVLYPAYNGVCFEIYRNEFTDPYSV